MGSFEEDLESFVQDFLDGKVEPAIKSEPLPESNGNLFVDVVALNY